jgi:tRNA pseudouridine32 synthase/23S rRNA pseudouridine746 synthase
VVNYSATDIVIFADEAVLVVNKPYGLRSLQDGYDKTLPHLVTVLEPAYGRLWMVHRLDRETSGVLVIARTAGTHRSLNSQFQNRQVVKIYHALASGTPEWETRRVNLPLRKDGDHQHRTVIDLHKGKPATTDFKLLEQLGAYCLIEARPFTGYTHQIRAHLSAIGFPIAVDPLYGSGAPILLLPNVEQKKGMQPILSRLGLHACSISFTHPLTGAEATFTAPYPPDLAEAILTLRQED